MQHDSSNTVFTLAADIVQHTGRHIFLTGKAGTGKTTFLKHIKEHATKNTVIVAPTGVAAINAGGVTMHSLFQLPFGPFVPSGSQHFNANHNVTDKHSLFKNIFFSSQKRELLQELELLIIDEVSMVRCDMLDAMDAILRHIRKQQHLPFGGVQMIYIGDLFQLPPVIPPSEWVILQDHYNSPFFFEAKALQDAPPLYIELKKIYRQNEQHFIDILNRIRNNVALPQDLADLNERFDPDFKPPDGENFITLSTHNRKADVINEAALKQLTKPLHQFTAEVEGDFNEKSLPTEYHLQLKEGAQIMFVKNDSGNERRYFNGKLAVVKQITKEKIIVGFDNGEDLELEKETWKNIRYHYDKEKDAVDEEELGSFKQYPIRLAWAITIHKSQGLTFNKAVIDAGAAFAPGQVYVALSRCTSLQGLILHSKILPASIATDQRIIAFAAREKDDAFLQNLLQLEKEKYQATELLKTFSWQKIVAVLQDWKTALPGKKLPDAEGVMALADDLLLKAQQHAEVADRFAAQLTKLVAEGDRDNLQQRINKAIIYFAKVLATEIIMPMQEHLQAVRFASKLVRYKREMHTLQAVLLQQLEKFNAVSFGDLVFVQYIAPSVEKMLSTLPTARRKTAKGETKRETLSLFKEGKTIVEIAQLRNLAVSTIESHLLSFLPSGQTAITDLVSQEKIDAILLVLQDATGSLSELKQRVAAEVSFGEIRAVVAWRDCQNDSKITSS